MNKFAAKIIFFTFRNALSVHLIRSIFNGKDLITLTKARAKRKFENVELSLELHPEICEVYTIDVFISKKKKEKKETGFWKS